MAGAVHGAVGVAWLQWLTERTDTLKADIGKAADAFCAQLVPDGASGQVERVGARFALVAAAGEMATPGRVDRLVTRRKRAGCTCLL